MQVQIEQGHEIRMMQNQLEEKLQQAINLDNQLQQKIQQYQEFVSKIKDLNYCSKEKIQNSSVAEEMIKKLQDHLEQIQKQKSEIEEFKSKEVENINRITYDFALNKMESLEQSHKIVLQDVFEQYKEQREKLYEIQIQKNQEDQFCMQEYIKISNINQKEIEKISQLKHELKVLEDQIIQKNQQEHEKLLILENNRKAQELQEQEQLDNLLLQESEKQIEELELKKIDIKPKIQVQYQILIREEQNLLNSQQMLLKVQSDQLQHNKTFKILINIIITLVILLISKCLIPSSLF